MGMKHIGKMSLAAAALAAPAFVIQSAPSKTSKHRKTADDHEAIRRNNARKGVGNPKRRKVKDNG